MPILIELDPESSDPPYEQIRTQIITLVIHLDLLPGDRLPSIRQLAGDLGLASGTVARAYRELENDGVVRSRGARGTTVVGPPRRATDRGPVMQAAKRLAAASEQAGIDLDETVAVLRIAFAAHRTPGAT